MLLRTFAFIVIIALSAVLLSSCGGIGEVRTPQPPLTFVPPPTPFVEGRCDVTSDLERWVQMAELRRLEFAGYIDNAGSKSREALYPDVERMGRIVSIINGTPVPDCAETTQMLLHEAMSSAAFMFQAYINRERDDLDVIISTARRNFAPAVVELEALTARLEQQYGVPGS